MAVVNNEYLKDHKLFRKTNKNIIAIFPLIAILVAILVFWGLKLVGITVTGDALCGFEEHTHVSECYIEEELVCTVPEHIHSGECFPNLEADLETSYDWKKTFEHVALTNDVSENIVAIANTQVGYSESILNYEYDAYAVKQGYNRYGQWYGTPYGDWNSIFVSFCINYANVYDPDPLLNASAELMRAAWEQKVLYFAADSYLPQRGDVVFFDTDLDAKADRTAIVTLVSEDRLIVIEGDTEGTVSEMVYTDRSTVMGYGKTSGLYAAEYIAEPDGDDTQSDVSVPEETDPEPDVTVPVDTDIQTPEPEPEPQEPESDGEDVRDIWEAEGNGEVSGRVNRYIPENSQKPIKFMTFRSPSRQSAYEGELLQAMADDDHDIIYTSELDNYIVGVSFKTQSGEELGNGSVVYIGESYKVSVEFSEINTGKDWVQFRHNEDGYLTYVIPSNIKCEPFANPHPISAKTENGTVIDVGEYYVDDTGMLKVHFYEDADGVNFVEKYSNIDFTIEFNATVIAAADGSTTEIIFNDKINVDLVVDGNAAMDVTKSHGEYDSATNTQEYTIKVQATNGVVKDLVIDDQIWENHYTLRDTIVVTDLNGNVLDPQPVVSDHPLHSQGVTEGFRLSGFPDFAAGQGFLITYKTQVYDELTSGDSVDMWNGVDAVGKNSLGSDIYVWADDWLRVELDKIEKNGKQSVITDNNGNSVPVIEWEVEIRKSENNLQGTVVIDTLGQGLDYYTGVPIIVKRYDEWGNRLPDMEISWDSVTVNGNTMTFELPDGYGFVIEYYTTYQEPEADETLNYTNSVKATINGREEQTQGSANVVGFTPNVSKKASGNDGKFIDFTIEADVPAVIKDRGGFYLTDLSAFWGYQDNDVGHLYVENSPQNMVITATTQSGDTVTFTPYVEGGPVENTYILVSPAGGDQMHSFNIYFNTANADIDSSKWILSEDAKLTISYKIPFDAKTGTEWEGLLSGDLTLEDVLLKGYKMANEAYFNYTRFISDVASTTYDYSPQITKQSLVGEDAVIDYTVVFNNNIPGSNGREGYVDGDVDKLWFNDTFDEKLEYVPGSLVVTGYSPWQKDLWLCKYLYSGTINGNTMKISAEDFKFLDYNEDADNFGWNGLSGTKDLRNYYHWVNAGGKFVFTYQLRVKDEYLYSAEHSHYQFDNVAELTWDQDGSSGKTEETTEFQTGLLGKDVVQDGSKLDFTIHINENALDIIDGLDHLTIYDTMTPNLSVYWDTIKLRYEKAPDVWVDFDSGISEYTYTVTFDPITNSLTFTVPDGLHIAIDYTTLITEVGLVSVDNTVKIDGKAEVSDAVDALFKVEEHSGGVTGFNNKITLIKQDALTDEPLPNATFALYGLKGDASATVPLGTPQNIITETGEVLKYIGTYTTGPDGTTVIETQYLTVGGPYALVEQVAPEGYELLKKPVYFYFYDTDPNGRMQTVTTLIAVENFAGSLIIPETGGMGIFNLTIIGIVLMAFPILYSLIRHKREGRLTN